MSKEAINRENNKVSTKLGGGKTFGMFQERQACQNAGAQ